MKFIRISINEFKALLNRACESYYGHKYDFEDTAAIIQWLEIHDLLGIINFLGITDVNPKKLNLTPILLKDKKKLLPCAAFVDGYYNLEGIYVGVPVIIGKEGVERIVEIDFAPDEKEMFDHSISAVKQLNEVASKFEAE